MHAALTVFPFPSTLASFLAASYCFLRSSINFFSASSLAAAAFIAASASRIFSSRRAICWPNAFTSAALVASKLGLSGARGVMLAVGAACAPKAVAAALCGGVGIGACGVRLPNGGRVRAEAAVPNWKVGFVPISEPVFRSAGTGTAADAMGLVVGIAVLAATALGGGRRAGAGRAAVTGVVARLASCL